MADNDQPGTLSNIIVLNVPLGLLIILTFLLIVLNCHFKESRNKPPGPWGIPCIGFLFYAAIGGDNYIQRLVELKDKYGKIISVRLGSFQTIWLNDIDLIKEAWGSQDFAGRPKVPGITQRAHGKLYGIILNDGGSAQEQRRFTIKTLKDLGMMGKGSVMEGRILEQAEVMVKILTLEAGAPISTEYLFSVPILNSLWGIVTGTRIREDEARMKELIETLHKNMGLSKGSKAGFFMPWLTKLVPGLIGWTDYLREANHVYDFWMDYVKERIKEFDLDCGEGSSFMDHYIRAMRTSRDPSSSFYGEEGERSLTGVVQDLFITGFETVETTLRWALLYLAVHSPKQKCLQNEIDAVIGTTRIPGLADRSKMSYTEAVINEVMRFGTLAPLGMIHSTTHEVQFHGHTIPKNTMILGNIIGIHLDKEYWGDPHNFRPERFLTNSTTGPGQEAQVQTRVIRNHKCFLPFSFGKRGCIGEGLARDELFLFITHIFQKFIVTTDPLSPAPSLEPVIGVSATPRPHKLIFHLKG